MPKERAWWVLIGSLVVVDLAAVLIALNMGAWLSSRPAFGQRGTPDWSFTLLVLPVFGLIFLAEGLYARENLLGGTREYAAVFRACTYGLLAIVLVSFVSKRTISREWIVLSWALTVVTAGTGRFLVRRAVYRLRRLGHFTAATIIVGADAQSLAVARQLSEDGSGVRILGFLDDYVPVGSVLGDGHRVLGSASALMQVAARTHAEDAIVVPQALPWETLQTLLSQAAATPNGLKVHLPAGFYDLLTTRVGLSEKNHVPLLTVKKARLTPIETVFKTVLDYSLAAFILVFCSPVILATAGWLRLNGSGTILERRPVIGQYGRPFTLLSFRRAGLARSPFIGKLPGLINVLRGELSIVGPRPMTDDADGSQTRLRSIRPGLTGSWREVNDPDKQAVLDLYYVRSYSVWLDLQVLFRRLRARLG
jgi:lipopolysaccharide/colanic/teichoic acid biosynthesis glycosyltransferase